MKKIYTHFFIPLFILLGVLFLNACSAEKTVEEGYNTFNLEDYNDLISSNSSDKKVGITLTGTDAMEKAKTVWLELYKKERIEKSFPYCRVSFDYQNEVWLVEFTPSFDNLNNNSDADSSMRIVYRGQGLGILVQKSDGKVLAVWDN
jgi:hypothetical protein